VSRASETPNPLENKELRRDRPDSRRRGRRRGAENNRLRAGRRFGAGGRNRPHHKDLRNLPGQSLAGIVALGSPNRKRTVRHNRRDRGPVKTPCLLPHSLFDIRYSLPPSQRGPWPEPNGGQARPLNVVIIIGYVEHARAVRTSRDARIYFNTPCSIFDIHSSAGSTWAACMIWMICSTIWGFSAATFWVSPRSVERSNSSILPGTGKPTAFHLPSRTARLP